MKRMVALTILAGVLVRLAVLAGAGETLGGWVRGLGADERIVSAALRAELGETPETPAPPQEQSAKAALPAAAESSEYYAAEEAESAGEAETPQETAAPAEIVAHTITGASSVHNSAGVALDVEALAAEGLAGLRLPAEGPQVLIFHTHSSEAYTQDIYDPYEASDPYRTEDKRYNVIRVGDVLAERFEAAGLTVLHDREIYDYPSYTGSYTRSGAAVEQYLAAHPSIRIVIDLHRDAIGSGDAVYKTQASLSGKTSAQVMLLVGTGQNGLWHPNWKENLKLALYMQAALDARYPTLARPIELVKERYNQQLSTGFLLIEVGSTGNTLAEATEAASLFGETVGPALAKLIET